MIRFESAFNGGGVSWLFTALRDVVVVSRHSELYVRKVFSD